MSIKILNGVRLPPGLTLEGVFGWVASLRPQLAALASREWFEAQCREALTLYDRQTAGAAGITLSGPLVQGNPFSQARRRLLADVSEAQKESRKHEFDFGFELGVIPHSSGLFGMMFASSAALREAFLRVEGVEACVYYDHISPPADLAPVWADRKKLWEDLLGPSYIPAHRCATFMLVEEDFHWLAELPESRDSWNLESLTPLSQRAHDVALGTPSAQFPEGSLRTSDMSACVAHLMALKKGEVPEFNAVREQIERVLRTEVSFEDLKMEANEG